MLISCKDFSLKIQERTSPVKLFYAFQQLAFNSFSAIAKDVKNLKHNQIKNRFYFQINEKQVHTLWNDALKWVALDK